MLNLFPTRQPYLLLILFVQLCSLQAQNLSPVWNRQVQIHPYDLHNLGNQIGAIGTNDDGLTELNVLDASGNLVLAQVIPEITLVGSSLFDASRQSFYVFGADDAATTLQTAQIKADGNTGWQLNVPSAGGFFLPYRTVQQGAHVAFTFGVLDDQGHSNALGWLIVDTAGVLVKKNIYPLQPSAEFPDIPFATAYTPDGDLVIGLSNVISGQCKVLKFNALSGDILWEKPFDFGAQGIIQTLCTDPSGNIYLSGENGFFVKLAPNGNVLFNKTMGYADITQGYKIIEHQGAVYIFGGWREDYSTLEAKMIVGRYDKETGDPNWIWVSEFGGTDHGPSATDAYFKDDSTLVIYFSRLFESDWIGEYKINSVSGTLEPVQAIPLQAYPNPGIDGHCKLQFPADESGAVRIFDLSGKLVREYPIAESVVVDLPCAGAYMAEAQGKVVVYRAVIMMQ